MSGSGSLVLPEFLRNGPAAIGISAGADVCTDPEVALPLSPVNPGMFAYVNVHIPVGISRKASLCSAYRMMAFSAAQYGYYGRDGHTRTIRDTDVSPTAEDVEKMKADSLIYSTVQASTMIVATKVNFWQMNHHVGSKELQGYCAKVARLHFEDDADIMRSAIWNAGHWADTRDVLLSIGFKGIAEGVQIPGFARASDDIQTRLSTNPAGTALLFDVYAVFTKASRSMYSMLLGVVEDSQAIVEGVHDVLADPARYHIGSRYLTGADRLAVYVPLEQTTEQAAAYIHATGGGSSLTKTRVLPSLQEIQSHQVYGTISSAKAIVLKNSFKPSDVARLTGGAASMTNRLAGFARMAGIKAFTPALSAAGTIQAAAQPAPAAYDASEDDEGEDEGQAGDMDHDEDMDMPGPDESGEGGGGAEGGEDDGGEEDSSGGDGSGDAPGAGGPVEEGDRIEAQLRARALAAVAARPATPAQTRKKGKGRGSAAAKAPAKRPRQG